MLDRVVGAPAGRGGPVRGPRLRGHRPRSPRRPGPPPRASARGARTAASSTPSTAPGSSSGEIVTDLDLPADAPRPDMCGTCTACLDACPTRALVAPYVLDATRCISYLTIEVKGDDPGGARREGVGRHVFGCDICQDVCPWNRRRRHHGGAAFEPRPGAEAPDLAGLAGLDEEAFRERFRRSPVKRAKRRGLLRNVAVALGNAGERRPPPAPRAAGRRRRPASCASTPPGGCGGSTSASVQLQALPELDLVARAGRELDLLAAGREHRGAARGAADEAALDARRSPPSAIAPMTDARRPPRRPRSSRPCPCSTRPSRRSRSRRCGRSSRRPGPGRTRPRGAPCPSPAPSARP